MLIKGITGLMAAGLLVLSADWGEAQQRDAGFGARFDGRARTFQQFDRTDRTFDRTVDRRADGFDRFRVDRFRDEWVERDWRDDRWRWRDARDWRDDDRPWWRRDNRIDPRFDVRFRGRFDADDWRFDERTRFDTRF